MIASLRKSKPARRCISYVNPLLLSGGTGVSPVSRVRTGETPVPPPNGQPHRVRISVRDRLHRVGGEPLEEVASLDDIETRISRFDTEEKAIAAGPIEPIDIK